MKTRTTGIAIVIAAIVLAFATACRKPYDDSMWSWRAERPQKMQETFSHEVHKEVLEREGFECFACHPMAVEIEEEKDIEEMIRASKETFFPGKETCHFCHYNPAAGNIAPEKCSLCHFNTRDIQPANHNYDWLTRHAVFSKGNPSQCHDCHTPRYCEDCHVRRDTTIRRAHDRNFRFVHAIEARANPSQCRSCHQLQSFCDKCHMEGGFER